jgi:hypothetical protein
MGWAQYTTEESSAMILAEWAHLVLRYANQAVGGSPTWFVGSADAGVMG